MCGGRGRGGEGKKKGEKEERGEGEISRQRDTRKWADRLWKVDVYPE